MSSKSGDSGLARSIPGFSRRGTQLEVTVYQTLTCGHFGRSRKSILRPFNRPGDPKVEFSDGKSGRIFARPLRQAVMTTLPAACSTSLSGWLSLALSTKRTSQPTSGGSPDRPSAAFSTGVAKHSHHGLRHHCDDRE